MLVDSLYPPKIWKKKHPPAFLFTTFAAKLASSEEEETRSAAEQTKQRWITCSSTKELAVAIKNYVRPGDSVAELGAQLREVSTAICESLSEESSGEALLVDVSRKFPKNLQGTRTRAMRLPGDEVDFYPNVSEFVEIAELDDWRSAFGGSTTRNFDVFVLDVNAIVGNDLEWTSLSIIREFAALYQPRVVLVKSMSLNQWASRLVHGQRWILNQGQHQDIPPTHVIATVGVHEYRKTIPFTVKPGDSVLEVGCHFGTSTQLLHEAADAGNGEPSRCIGVDVGSKIIREAKKKYPSIYFAVGDAWKTASLLRLQKDFDQTHQLQSKREGFDVVYIDVGGLSGNDGLLESLCLISSIINALEPRCIVIKSLCMQRLSSALTPAWRDGRGTLS